MLLLLKSNGRKRYVSYTLNKVRYYFMFKGYSKNYKRNFSSKSHYYETPSGDKSVYRDNDVSVSYTHLDVYKRQSW